MDTTATKMLDYAKDMAGAMSMIAAALLQAAIQAGKAISLKAGVGEMDPQDLAKSLEKNENLCWVTLSKDEYEVLTHTNLMQDMDVRKFSFVQGTNRSEVLLQYGSGSEEAVTKALEGAEAALGKRSEISKDAFFSLAGGKETRILSGISEPDIWLLRKFSEENGNFPYSVVEKDGENHVVCLEEDKTLLNENMRMVCGVRFMPDGDRIIEDITYNIKGRQVRNEAIRDARKNAAIFDRGQPGTGVEFTERDISLYKNNLCFERFSRSDEASLPKAYQLVEEMSEPVKAKDWSEIKTMTQPEIDAYIRNNKSEFTAFDPSREIGIDEKQLQRAMSENEASIDKQMGSYRIYRSESWRDGERQTMRGKETVPEEER